MNSNNELNAGIIIAKKLYDKEYATEFLKMNIVTQAASIIALRRKKMGLSQTDLAELTGTTQTAISRLENGRGNPTLKTISNVMSAMGLVVELNTLTIDDFYTRSKKNAGSI